MIKCDASNVVVGAVLGQIVDKKFHPVSSQHLTTAESRYSTTESELLAIVWASKRFNLLNIYGRKLLLLRIMNLWL
jgi:hypothetical protein